MSTNIIDASFHPSIKPRRSLRLPLEELRRETRSSSRFVVEDHNGRNGRNASTRNTTALQQPSPTEHESCKRSKEETRNPLLSLNTNEDDTHSIASIHSLHAYTKCSSELQKNEPIFISASVQQKNRRFPQALFSTRLIRDVLSQAFCGLLSLIVVAWLIAAWVWQQPLPILMKDVPKARQLYELQDYLSSAAKSIHEKLDMVDNLAAKRVEIYRKDMEHKIEEQATTIGIQMDALKTRITEIDQSLSKLHQREFLTMNDALQLITSVVDKREAQQSKDPLSLDDVKAAARKIVEAELGKHEADGLGRVDYALASGGGNVVGHSKEFNSEGASIWILPLRLFRRGNWKLSQANKILEPSLGEPGQCLALAGSNVHVDVALRTFIYPKEVILEHVSKKVAYDRSTAPKDFSVYGWEANPKVKGGNWVSLGAFTYDLEKHYVQTFNLSQRTEEKFFNMIRLHVLSNYGSASHTCIYRLRVHGSEPQNADGSQIPVSQLS